VLLSIDVTQPIGLKSMPLKSTFKQIFFLLSSLEIFAIYCFLGWLSLKEMVDHIV